MKNHQKYDYFLLNSTVPRPKKNKILLCAILMSVVILTCYVYNESIGESSKPLVEYLKSFTPSPSPEIEEIKPTKFILFWVQFDSDKSWYTGGPEEVGEDLLKSVQCPETNCIFTHNRSLTNLTNFDAILYHIPSGLHPFQMPKERSEHQLYVMVSLE